MDFKALWTEEDFNDALEDLIAAAREVGLDFYVKNEKLTNVEYPLLYVGFTAPD